MWIKPGDCFQVQVEHAGRTEPGYLYFSKYDSYICVFSQGPGDCHTLHDQSFYQGDMQFVLTEQSVLSDTSCRGVLTLTPLEPVLLTLKGFVFERYSPGPDSVMGSASVTFKYREYEVRPYLVDEPLIVERREE